MLVGVISELADYLYSHLLLSLYSKDPLYFLLLELFHDFALKLVMTE